MTISVIQTRPDQLFWPGEGNCSREDQKRSDPRYILDIGPQGFADKILSTRKNRSRMIPKGLLLIQKEKAPEEAGLGGKTQEVSFNQTELESSKHSSGDTGWTVR